MKTVAFCCLLYGRDYLRAALSSVVDAVDEVHVVYDSTGHGSHGATTDIPCPDQRWELMTEAARACGAKLRWHDGGPFQHEGFHRESIHHYAWDADVILVVDSDEVYQDGLAFESIYYAWNNTNARTVRLPFTHLWRSFKRGFAHDPAYPHRVIVPSRSEIDTTMPTQKRVFHYGYAIRPELVEWKWRIHGHRAELREDWFRKVFMTNRQYDCHPCGSQYWDCEDIDQEALPSVLKDHLYHNLPVIGEVIP